MREYVPVDEGEAEAQEAAPIILKQRLIGPHYRVGVQAVWGRLSVLDALLHEAIVKWVQEEGWILLHQPKQAWDVIDGERWRTADFTIAGHLP